MVDPDESECLLCYLRRAVLEVGCDHTWEHVRRFRDVRVPAAVGLEQRLTGVGACCGCTVLERGFWPARSLWQRDLDTDELTWPTPWPGCAGVGPTSARPCAHWVRRTRWDLPSGW